MTRTYFRFRPVSKAFSFALAVASGCAPADDGAGEIPAAEDGEVEVAVVEQAVTSGWTLGTSEEYAPVYCDGASAMDGVRCSGKYCDNVAIHCGSLRGAIRGGSYWTPYYSEENPGGANCAPNHFVTGLKCRGKYCDDMSLQCTYFPNVTYWAEAPGWIHISEEWPNEVVSTDHVITGGFCQGKYCDFVNMYPKPVVAVRPQ